MDGTKQKIPDTNKSFFKQNNIAPESIKVRLFIGYCRCSTMMQAIT